MSAVVLGLLHDRTLIWIVPLALGLQTPRPGTKFHRVPSMEPIAPTLVVVIKLRGSDDAGRRVSSLRAGMCPHCATRDQRRRKDAPSGNGSKMVRPRRTRRARGGRRGNLTA